MSFLDVCRHMTPVQERIRAAMKLLGTYSSAFRGPADDGGFGYGEQLVHLVQIAKFHVYFVEHYLLQEPGRHTVVIKPFPIPDVLRPAIGNQEELDRLNLLLARKKVESFDRFKDFRLYVELGYAELRSHISSLPVSHVHSMVGHPLRLDWNLEAVEMLERQVIDHAHHHLDQLAVQLQKDGYDFMPTPPVEST